MRLSYNEKIRALVDELGMTADEAEVMLEDMGEDHDDREYERRCGK